MPLCKDGFKTDSIDNTNISISEELFGSAQSVCPLPSGKWMNAPLCAPKQSKLR